MLYGNFQKNNIMNIWIYHQKFLSNMIFHGHLDYYFSNPQVEKLLTNFDYYKQ